MMRMSVVVALALMLCACSVLDAVNPFSSSSKIKPAELTPIHVTAELHLLWRGQASDAGSYSFTPAVVNSSVYAAGTDGTLVRFDDGREVWRIQVGQALSGGVAANENAVVVGTPEGSVFAFDSVGKPLWTAVVSSEVLAPPTIIDGMVLVRSGDARIFAFNLADGQRKWVYQRAMPALTVRSQAGVVPFGNYALAGFPGGRLAAIALNNGGAAFETTVSLPKGTTELERVSDVTSNPTIGSEELCASAYQGKTTCFDRANGAHLWSREIASATGVVLDDRYVYVADDVGVVYALDRKSGVTVWKQDKLLFRQPTRPLVFADYIVVADYQGVLHLLNKLDGAFAGRFVTDGSPVTAELKSLGGNSFIVQTHSGTVFAVTF